MGHRRPAASADGPAQIKLWEPDSARRERERPRRNPSSGFRSRGGQIYCFSRYSGPGPPAPVWPLFGGYNQVSSIGDTDFFKNVGQYVKAFDAAAKALGRAGFLLDEDEKDLTRKAKLNPSSTFTQNYQAGLF